MKRLRIFLLLTTIVSIAVGYILMPEKVIDERPYLREIAPDVIFPEKNGNPAHYRSDKGVVGFNTYDVTPSIRGYAGPIKMLLAINSEGKIIGIRIFDHKETKNYVHYMETPEYLGQFLGKSVNDDFEIEKDMDGISRATVSVEAMAKTVRESSRMVASSVYGIDVRTGETRALFDIKWILYLLIFSFALTFYFFTRISKRYLKIRDVSLMLGLLVIGFYLSSPFSVLHVFNVILLRPSSAIIWYVIITSTILSVIVAGRFYCGWICPFGALSEVIGRIHVKKWVIPVDTDDRWRKVKYYLLALIVSLVFISRRPEFGNYETYITFFSFHGNYLTWGLVVVALISNLKVGRFWCRYLCPVAAFTGILSRSEAGYPGRYDCPMSNKPNPMISECIRCNRCHIKSC